MMVVTWNEACLKLAPIVLKIVVPHKFQVIRIMAANTVKVKAKLLILKYTFQITLQALIVEREIFPEQEHKYCNNNLIVNIIVGSHTQISIRKSACSSRQV